MTSITKAQFIDIAGKLFDEAVAGGVTQAPEPQPAGYTFKVTKDMFEANAGILTLPVDVVDLARVPVGAGIKLPDGSVRTVTSSDTAYNKTKAMIKFDGGAVSLSGVVEVVSPSEAPKPEDSAKVEAPKPVGREWNPGFAMGINVAGAEFGSTKPGTINKDYIYPQEKDLKPSAEEGMRLIRYPFRLERLFQSLGGAFRESDLKQFDKAMDDAAKLNLLLNIEAHNYFEWMGKEIADYLALAKSWASLTNRYRGHPAVESFGIMNEPKGTNGRWWKAAAEAQKAVQDVDPDRNMTFCGDTYANGFGFMKKNVGIEGFEWGPRSALEIHTYFDTPHGGSYSNRAEKISPTIGPNRMQEARAYAEPLGVPIIHGEFGIPWNMDQTPMDVHIADAKSHNERCYAWAAGPWWSESAANGMFVKGKWRESNLAVLKKYL